MAAIEIRRELDLVNPTLVEGLPGVGLVGKIATDHVVDALEMDHYASVYCEGLPRVSVYEDGSRDLHPPVRIFADEEQDVLALQSDVPVSPEHAPEFTTCLVNWFETNDVTPLCLSGLAEEKSDPPAVFAVGTGNVTARLDSIGLDTPPSDGLVSGPTGALLSEATRRDIDAVGLVVQANQQFPDPEAARALIVRGIEPLTGIEVETSRLVDQAEDIAAARERLAKRMQEATDESSQATPIGMYQ